MEPNHELSYVTGGILRGIQDLPEAAELALDELRRDPLGAEDSSRIEELHLKYGSEVSSFFSFFGRVIANTKTFIEIDFKPDVDKLVAVDESQNEVIDQLYIQHRNNYHPDDISPEQVVALSNRANLLRAVATLAIQDRISSYSPGPTQKALSEEVIQL